MGSTSCFKCHLLHPQLLARMSLHHHLIIDSNFHSGDFQVPSSARHGQNRVHQCPPPPWPARPRFPRPLLHPCRRIAGRSRWLPRVLRHHLRFPARQLQSNSGVRIQHVGRARQYVHALCTFRRVLRDWVSNGPHPVRPAGRGALRRAVRVLPSRHRRRRPARPRRVCARLAGAAQPARGAVDAAPLLRCRSSLLSFLSKLDELMAATRPGYPWDRGE
mmetsp:Transcript_18812/g.39639  ORF Transcript_18812/g.39639 Transcript_18812/m.39639 type:complete len:218 (+) Transcript_18812:270-923(+)